MRFIRFIRICLLFIIIQISGQAQDADRKYHTQKITNAPKVDGILNDDVWKTLPVATDFYQFEPYNGIKPSQRTEVRIGYTNSALYLGAILYDSSPDSISKNLCKRDEGFQSNTDLFVLIINPFNDKINSFEFTVTASGVQNDLRHAGTNGFIKWDAVWKSVVTLNDSGWVVEYEIPFSALRFPKVDVQEWGLHLFRHINRYREWDAWNYVSQENEDFVSQDGTLLGVSNIDPPLRLSVTPYISSYLEKNPENTQWGSRFKGGMDLKYGINESFTLDMILIPDFGQVESDDKILNLSPFEINYDEKRPFFTEGNELFNKAGIFYSRRIGGTPYGHDDLENNIDSTETIISNPQETGLINASKISGRLPNGLGIGFFNAITGETVAEVEDTISSEKRKIQTQPFTNYNIVVFDQSLKNKSYVSIINTNLNHNNNAYWANVTGSEFKLTNNQLSYAVSGGLNYSQVNESVDSLVDGYKMNLKLEKIKGNFLFEVGHNIESDTYNPNDMGFIYNNNKVTNYLKLKYNIYKPFWRVLNWRNRIDIFHQQLYSPRVYNTTLFALNSHTTFKNHLSTGMFFNFEPKDEHDYFEAREDGRLYIKPKASSIRAWISSDYRKAFALDINASFFRANKYNRSDNSFNVSPRLRPNNKMLFVYNFRREISKNNIGFTESEDDGDIIFAKRNRYTIVNTLNVAYTFTNKASLSFRMRHYWSRLENNQFYSLQQDGYLSNELGYDYFLDEYDYNFNNFNIDLLYIWNFAPGSELSISWKNIIDDPDVPMEEKYFRNLENIFESTLSNSISLKLLYYLDYNYLMKK